MEEYGIMVNGQLIRLKKWQEGAKVIVYSEPEIEEGWTYSFHWEEGEIAIVQVWDAYPEEDE